MVEARERMRQRGRAVRPGRFTFRELLMLATLCSGERRSYLDMVFGWYFDRSRAFVIGALAGSVAATGVALNADDFGTGAMIAIAVSSVLAISALGVNHLLSRLHREHLCCLILLEELSRFRDHVSAAISKDGEPESWAYGYRSGSTADALEECLEPAVPRRKLEGHVAIGRYLFASLGPVPTEHYERDRVVQERVKQVLATAGVSLTPRGTAPPVHADDC